MVDIQKDLFTQLNSIDYFYVSIGIIFLFIALFNIILIILGHEVEYSNSNITLIIVLSLVSIFSEYVAYILMIFIAF